MDINHIIDTRFSCKKYLSKKPKLSLISQMLEQAIKAPTAGNLHSFRFVVVNHEDLKLKIAKSSFNQIWMAEAPYLIVVCYDSTNLKRHYNEKASQYGIQETAIISTFLLLLAKEHGLDGCFVSAFIKEEISRFLELPDNVIPEVIIPLGYANEVKKKTYRPSIDLVTFYNEYGSKNFSHNLEDKVSELKNKTKKIESWKKLKQVLKL